MKYANLRKDYQKHTLEETDLPADPFELFHPWFEMAVKDNEAEANAMVLATIGADGFPNSRVVLLKEVDTGFVWFTNYGSQKGKDLQANPKASLTFWWPERERQVRVKGSVEKVLEAESDAYFSSRPRGSQAGAIVSKQSEKLDGRIKLDEAYSKLLELSDDQKLKRPILWGGYRLIPSWFEFWQGRSNRLHDRLFYEKQTDGSWSTGRLSP